MDWRQQVHRQPKILINAIIDCVNCATVRTIAGIGTAAAYNYYPKLSTRQQSGTILAYGYYRQLWQVCFDGCQITKVYCTALAPEHELDIFRQLSHHRCVANKLLCSITSSPELRYLKSRTRLYRACLEGHLQHDHNNTYSCCILHAGRAFLA